MTKLGRLGAEAAGAATAAAGAAGSEATAGPGTAANADVAIAPATIAPRARTCVRAAGRPRPTSDGPLLLIAHALPGQLPLPERRATLGLGSRGQLLLLSLLHEGRQRA